MKLDAMSIYCGTPIAIEEIDTTSTLISHTLSIESRPCDRRAIILEYCRYFLNYDLQGPYHRQN